MNTGVQIQSPSQFGSHSLAARWLHSGLNVNALRTNALLRYDDWKDIDRTVLQIATVRMSGWGDLRARGLTRNLGGLGVIMTQWQRASDMDPAEISMSGITRGQKDRVDFDTKLLPVPIIHKDFSLEIRHLEASRRNGVGLDAMQAQIAARLVAETAEDLLFNGSSITVDGNAIYGYRTHPDRNVIATAADWGTVANIYSSVIAMIAALVADRMFGPYILYVSDTQYIQALAQEGVDNFSNVMTRLQQIPNLQGIKPTYALPDGTALMVQLSSEVVDAEIGQDITTVEWNEMGGMQANFKVMMAAVPRIKSDAAGRSGVVVHTGV
ncbi:MAG: major capsid protein [Candidatus Binatia bacterium]